MPSLSLIKTAIRELLTASQAPRVNEPDLVMDDPDKVNAFTQAGRADGVMAPVYIFHAAQVSEIVKPGDTVVDLGCGPATQLGMIASLNPETRFIGIDLSEEMLDKARPHIRDLNLKNITFQKGNITDLSMFADASVDAVYSTVVLHHLPDLEALEKTFSEARRILKPGGGLYIVDFGRLKTIKSMEVFANQYADRQPELFTFDYFYSLRAAFTKEDFSKLGAKYFSGVANTYSTLFMPYMVAVKSSVRTPVINPGTASDLKSLYQQMPNCHKRDIGDLQFLFKLGGMPSSALGQALA